MTAKIPIADENISVIEYRELTAQERTEEESAYVVEQIEKEVKTLLTVREAKSKAFTYKVREKLISVLQTLDNLPIVNAETKVKRKNLVDDALLALGEYRPSHASGNRKGEIDRLAEERVARAERLNGLSLPLECLPKESISAGSGGDESVR